MSAILYSISIAIAVLNPDNSSRSATNELAMFEPVQQYIRARMSEFETIDADRKAELKEFAKLISVALSEGKPAKLNFICTHNSRRSHLSQIWATIAARHVDVSKIHTYSGGTESTAFNPRAVAALERAGLQIKKTTDDDNPIYHVSFSNTESPITCFSKVFHHAPNPKEDFVAIMTCSSADKACPAVTGAAHRIAITYEDPKAFDGTEKESKMYDERCAQISREMLYVFSIVAKNSNRNAAN